MRLTDDYFFVSDSKQNAELLIEQLFKCAKANKFSFNKDKITTNFTWNIPDTDIFISPTIKSSSYSTSTKLLIHC